MPLGAIFFYAERLGAERVFGAERLGGPYVIAALPHLSSRPLAISAATATAPDPDPGPAVCWTVRSVLTLLASRPQLSSLRQDLLPYLTQQQFRLKALAGGGAGPGSSAEDTAATNR